MPKQRKLWHRNCDLFFFPSTSNHPPTLGHLSRKSNCNRRSQPQRLLNRPAQIGKLGDLLVFGYHFTSFQCLIKLGLQLLLRLWVYSNRAIQVLIGAFGQAQRPFEDQNLMATVILLRTLEQFPELSGDRQYHFEGAWCLFAAEDLRWSPFRIDLRGVAFCIFVREKIHLSLLTERAFRFDVDSIYDDKPWSPAPDETWTSRMSSILARTCLLSFSRTVRDHQKLLDQIRRSMIFGYALYRLHSRLCIPMTASLTSFLKYTSSNHVTVGDMRHPHRYTYRGNFPRVGPTDISQKLHGSSATPQRF